MGRKERGGRCVCYVLTGVGVKSEIYGSLVGEYGEMLDVWAMLSLEVEEEVVS